MSKKTKNIFHSLLLVFFCCSLFFLHCDIAKATTYYDANGNECPECAPTNSVDTSPAKSTWTPTGKEATEDVPFMETSPTTTTTPKTTTTSPTTTTPATTSPATTTTPTTTSPTTTTTDYTGTLVPCGLEGKADCTLCHLVLGFKNIYDYLLVLLLSATTLVVVVAGVMYMVSSGDKGMIDKAKSALTYALTAMILALTAWLIINATLTALGYTKVDNWYTFTCDTTQTKGSTGGTGTGGTGTGGAGTGNTGGTGCAAVVNNIKSMENWAYTSEKNGNLSLRNTNGYGDCSSTTVRAYTNAGCKSPGGDSKTMYANASQFTGAANLKAGDALVRNGHVGICLVDGCAQIMGASTADGIHPSSGSSMINDSSIRVIKVSDYCPASSC